MAGTFPYEPALSALRTNTKGVFNPHLYSIGSTAHPRFFADKLLYDRLRREIAKGDMDLLSAAITIHHELIHLIQFLSTGVGAQALLLLDAAITSMGDEPTEKSLPLLLDQSPATAPRSLLTERFQSLVSFYAAEFQFFEGHGPGLKGWPTSETDVSLHHFSEHPPANSTSDFVSLFPAAPIAIIDGARTRSLAFETLGDGLFRYVDLNAGKLFEAFAILSEFNLILWLDDQIGDAEWSDRYLSGLPLEYRCVIRAYLRYYGKADTFLTPNLAALIDIALMYDPVFLGTETTVEPAPIMTFWRVCEAARDVAPVSSDDPTDAQRFQDEVCAAAGIETTLSLAKRTLAMLDRNMTTVGPSPALRAGNTKAVGDKPGDLSVPLTLHRSMLSLRCELPVAFFWRILDPEFTQLFFQAHHPSIVFYDIARRERWDDKPWLWFLASIGSVALDAANKKLVDCPLKEGRPYYCNSRKTPFGVFCVRHDAKGATLFCPFAAFHTKSEIGVDLADRCDFD